MRLAFRGTRGSLPAPGPDTVRYGGNTTCIEVRSDAGELLILGRRDRHTDAGG